MRSACNNSLRSLIKPGNGFLVAHTCRWYSSLSGGCGPLYRMITAESVLQPKNLEAEKIAALHGLGSHGRQLTRRIGMAQRMRIIEVVSSASIGRLATDQ